MGNDQSDFKTPSSRSPPPSKPTYKSENYDRNSIVDTMRMKGMDSTYKAREQFAYSCGLRGYSGKAEENVFLLGKLNSSSAVDFQDGKRSKLSSSSVSTNYISFSSPSRNVDYDRNSVEDTLKVKGMDGSYKGRKQLAHSFGILDYKGKPKENEFLLSQLNSSSTAKNFQAVKPFNFFSSVPNKSSFSSATQNFDRNSLKDTMKVKGLDSSFEGQKLLAKSFGMCGYKGKAKENVFLLGQLNSSSAFKNFKITTTSASRLEGIRMDSLTHGSSPSNSNVFKSQHLKSMPALVHFDPAWLYARAGSMSGCCRVGTTIADVAVELGKGVASPFVHLYNTVSGRKESEQDAFAYEKKKIVPRFPSSGYVDVDIDGFGFSLNKKRGKPGVGLIEYYPDAAKGIKSGEVGVGLDFTKDVVVDVSGWVKEENNKVTNGFDLGAGFEVIDWLWLRPSVGLESGRKPIPAARVEYQAPGSKTTLAVGASWKEDKKKDLIAETYGELPNGSPWLVGWSRKDDVHKARVSVGKEGEVEFDSYVRLHDNRLWSLFGSVKKNNYGISAERFVEGSRRENDEVAWNGGYELRATTDLPWNFGLEAGANLVDGNGVEEVDGKLIYHWNKKGKASGKIFLSAKTRLDEIQKLNKFKWGVGFGIGLPI